MTLLDDTRTQQRRQMARMFVICDRLGLTRHERLEVAAFVVDRPISSFNDLHPVELERVRDAFEATFYTCHLLMEKQAGRR